MGFEGGHELEMDSWLLGENVGTMFLDLQKARMAIGFFEGKNKFSNL